MVPPPSAVMHPSRHTPTQSMLRRPAASAAVIACAASATIDSPCRTISLDGRFCIASSGHPQSESETYVAGSLLNRHELSTGRAAPDREIRRNPGTPRGYRRLSKGLTEETIHGQRTHSKGPLSSDFRQ